MRKDSTLWTVESNWTLWSNLVKNVLNLHLSWLLTGCRTILVSQISTLLLFGPKVNLRPWVNLHLSMQNPIILKLLRKGNFFDLVFYYLLGVFVCILDLELDRPSSCNSIRIFTLQVVPLCRECLFEFNLAAIPLFWMPFIQSLTLMILFSIYHLLENKLVLRVWVLEILESLIDSFWAKIEVLLWTSLDRLIECF